MLRIKASRGTRDVVVLAITKCGGFEKIVTIILTRTKKLLLEALSVARGKKKSKNLFQKHVLLLQ